LAETPAKLYVAREADFQTLHEHWTATREGDPRTVLLSAPIGGGKRAMSGELVRAAIADDDDVLIWRVPFHDEEDGMQTLLRIYAGLLQGLHRTPILRGKVEMALNSQVPSQPKRVQGWYQAFIEGLKRGAPKPGEDKFQVVLPRDNPLLGLVEIALGIARRFPVVLDLQNLHHCHSLGIHAFIEALLDGALSEEGACYLLTIIGTEPFDEMGRTWFTMPLIDLLDRNSEDIATLELTPWDAGDVDRYLKTKDLKGDGAQIARIAGGRPGFIAELIDWLEDAGRLEDDLSSMNLGDVADVAPDDGELDEPEEGAKAEGQRTHAGAADAERVAYIAALLGISFPSGLVADIGSYDRESVDDLLDATEGIYKELQFSEPMGTWIYQFHKALLRESVLARHRGDEDRELARRTANFMERFLVPRGYAFLVKTMRLYAENGDPQRASILRSVALGNDQSQLWAMTQDLLRHVDQIDWPDPMRRTVYMHLLDRMVQGGDVNQTETLWGEAMKWANDRSDRPMQAWLLFAGSRLDYRRQDLYRARDRANDSVKLYTALDDKLKAAEVHDHLAMIELADGNPNAAVDQARLAEEISPLPPMQAQSAFVQGLVAKRERKFPQAIEFFRKANEIAGRAGIGPLALEAGLNLGETLLVSGQHSSAADVLARVRQIAGALRNPVRERTATALLAQAHAALKNYEAALQHATRTLELTRELKFTRLEPVDLYNMGFFTLMLGRATEAVSLFRQARDGAATAEPGFLKELLFNMGNALLQIGEKSQAEETLKASLEPSTATKDWRKVMAANQQLATLAEERGEIDRARALLEAALKAAETGNLKEERKPIRRKLDALGS